MDVKFNQAASAYNTIAKMDVKKMAQMATEALVGAKDQSQPEFSQLVGDALSKAASTGYKTESTSAKALANKVDLTDLVTTVNNMELTLNTVVAIRDKVITAYNDIVKMAI